MNIMDRYTVRALRKNRKRTIVTVIGILLSVALFTAVTEGAYSGQQFLIRIAEQETGRYHLFFRDLTEEQRARLERDPAVEELAVMDTVGYADVGTGNTTWPYLYIGAVDGKIRDLVSIELLDGRMPQTDTELLVPSHLKDIGGVNWQTGQQVTLEVGQRVCEGRTLGQGSFYTSDEQLTDFTEKTYTVVGHYEKLSYEVEGSEAAGFLSFTGGSGVGSYTAYLTLDSISDVYNFAESGKYGDDYEANRDLLSTYGSVQNSGTADTLYGLVAILLALISAGSISLIYNAFSISVSERTRQFGMLRSFGATKRQLRHSVLFEALCLCAIAVPLGLGLGCAGIGVILYLLRDEFGRFFAFRTGSGVQANMRLVIGVWPLMAAAGVGVVTSLISAWIPARRAGRISAMEAISRTRDVKLPRHGVKTSKLTQKLFGLEGTLAVKNYKRSRKTYRATVISLCMSIVLFVSVSSFTSYLKREANAVAGSSQAGILGLFSALGDEERIRPEAADALYCQLAAVDGVERSGYYARYGLRLTSSDVLSDAYADLFGEYTPSMNLYFLTDEAFARLLEENALDPEAYFRPEAPLGVFYNRSYGSMRENGERVYYDVPVLRDVGQTMEAEYDLVTGEGESQTLSCTLSIGAVIDGFAELPPTDATIYYPISQMKQVMGDFSPWDFGMYFYAANHREAYVEMMEIYSDSELYNYNGYLTDEAEERETIRGFVLILDVFSYGLIGMISLIAAVNVFNTISTNIMLRRREFAMLQSIGMSRGGLRRMLNYECLVYGLRALGYGIPISLVVTWLIYKVVGQSFEVQFLIPWKSIWIAAACVFAVVFVTMIDARQKLRKENLIDALKDENI